MNIFLKSFLFLIGAVLLCGLLNGAALTAQNSDFLTSTNTQIIRVFQTVSSFTSFGPKNYSLHIIMKDFQKFGDRVLSSDVLKNLWNSTVTFHDEVEEQLELSLKKVFGSDAFFLPSNVSKASTNLLSGILLGIWLIFGWLSFSKMSYSKFFTFTSTLFLLNAVFGPEWCFHRFLFIVALFAWIMEKAAKKPVEAAGVVLVVFGLSLIGKWKEKIKGKKNAEAALANTKSMMEMIQKLDQKIENCSQKMDILLRKVEK